MHTHRPIGGRDRQREHDPDERDGGQEFHHRSNGENAEAALPETLADPFFARFQQLPAHNGTGNVVRNDAFAELFSAERAVAEARAVADDLDERVAKAEKAGRAEGLAAGRREAAHEFANHLARIERQMADFFQSAESTIAELGISVAESIIGSIDAQEAASLAARRAIIAHLDRHAFAIHVAPGAEQTIIDILADIRVERPGARLPVPRVDKRLQNGRALLVTRHGSVELDIDSQIQAIRESLRSGRPLAQSPPPAPRRAIAAE